MGNFAENLNLGNRFRPPLGEWVQKKKILFIIVFNDKISFKN